MTSAAGSFQRALQRIRPQDIGNGAPNDGFGLTEVHGWAFGSLASGGAHTYYLDDVSLVKRVDVIDDFETGLPYGHDANNIPIGFITWSDGSPVAITTTLVTDRDPLAMPCQVGDNNLYKVDLDIASWGGTTHAFENAAVDTWVSQDWSTYEGISFWLYGQNTGNTLMLELKDNRKPGSTTDDAETWAYPNFMDDFSGWKYFTLPFSAFQRKDIGNGAPNDGFTLTEAHGWAFGSLASGGRGPTTWIMWPCTAVSTRVVPFEVAVPRHRRSPVTEGASAVVTATLSMTSTEAVTVTYHIQEASARRLGLHRHQRHVRLPARHH